MKKKNSNNNNNDNSNNINNDDDYYYYTDDDDDDDDDDDGRNNNNNSNSEAVLNLDSDLSLACSFTGNETMTQTEYIEFKRYDHLRVALYNYEKYHLQNENRVPPSAQTIHEYEERLTALKCNERTFCLLARGAP